jgi:hypothetical protein
LINLNIAEKRYLEIIEDKTSIKDFEHWLYKNQEEISSDSSFELYEELIQINYNSSESKHILSKVINIDFEKLELYQIQQLIINATESQETNIKRVNYELDVYEMSHICFDFSIGGVAFRMHNPFKILNFVNLENEEREFKFSSQFGDELQFLNSILNSLDTDDFRGYSYKKHEQVDTMTNTQIILTKEYEYKIRINRHLCYIKKNYIKEQMKGAWL